MNIEDARTYCLSLPNATEDLFVEDLLTFRIEGKWFVLMWLDTAEKKIAVKLPPERGAELREHYYGITPAYHMNKRHWNDLLLDSDVPDELIEQLVKESYNLVISKLPKALREKYQASR